METLITVLVWFTYFVAFYFVVFWLLVLLFENKPKKTVKKLNEFPLVTIVIPAYNEEKRIKATLNSVLRLEYPKSKLEFIVVDDGSTDNTRKVVEKVVNENRRFNITLVSQKNKGKGAALNSGLKLAKGEFFICLDADSFVKKNALKRTLPYFDKEDVACVLPVLKVGKPRTFIQRMQWFEYIVNIFYKELMSRLNCVHVAPGPFSVYKTQIIKDVGYFDENNLTEDMEMAMRLQSKHYKIVQLLDSEVSTMAPKTLKQLYRQRNRWYKGAIYNALNYRGMILNRNYGDFGLIQMPTILISGVLAVSIIFTLFYYNVWIPIASISNLRYVDFDFLTLIKNFTIDFNILDLNFTTLLLSLIMLVVSAYVLMKSHASVREKINKYGALSLGVYMFVYFVLLGLMWAGVLFEMLIGKKQRW